MCRGWALEPFNYLSSFSDLVVGLIYVCWHPAAGRACNSGPYSWGRRKARAGPWTRRAAEAIARTKYSFLLSGISALLAWLLRLHWSVGSLFPNSVLVGACIPAALGLQSCGSPAAHRSPAHVSQSRWGRSVCGRNGPGGPGRRAIAAGLENFCVQ